MLDVRLGDIVVILGTGPIGCWQAVMCRDRGASRICMTDVQQDRLDLAMGIVGAFVDDAWRGRRGQRRRGGARAQTAVRVRTA